MSTKKPTRGGATGTVLTPPSPPATPQPEKQVAPPGDPSPRPFTQAKFLGESLVRESKLLEAPISSEEDLARAVAIREKLKAHTTQLEKERVLAGDPARKELAGIDAAYGEELRPVEAEINRLDDAARKYRRSQQPQG